MYVGLQCEDSGPRVAMRCTFAAFHVMCVRLSMMASLEEADCEFLAWDFASGSGLAPVEGELKAPSLLPASMFAQNPSLPASRLQRRQARCSSAFLFLLFRWKLQRCKQRQTTMSEPTLLGRFCLLFLFSLHPP